MAISPFYFDRVKYTLEYKPVGQVVRSQVVQEPEGWETDDKEITRNDDYHGIFAKFSNALTFVGDGADFIRDIDAIYGVNAKIRLVREEKNPKTDIWERAYDGYLDLTTMEEEGKKLSVKFSSAGLEQILKSREDEKIEIERLTTMDGKPIDPIRVDQVALDGRRIFLKTMFDVKPEENSASVAIDANSNNTRYESVPVPLNLFSESHEEAQSPIPQTHGNEQNGTTGLMFFADNERDRVIKIDLSITFTANITRKDDTSNSRYELVLARYTNGVDYERELSGSVVLFTTVGNGGLDALGGDVFANPFSGINNNPPTTHSVSWSGEIALLAGESLSLEFMVRSTLGGALSEGHLNISAQNISGFLNIIEDSFVEKSQSNFILAFELANRLLEVMSGSKTALKSNILGRTDLGYAEDGKASLTGYAHGLWIRQFSSAPMPEPGDVNLFRPLTTSWKEFITSNQAIWNIGLGIERDGYKESVVIEELSYFYNNQVTVRLPNQITKQKKSVATKYYYSGIELGYAKGGEYEEAMGLDEYNAKSTFTTIITGVKNVYSRLSLYRADSYGKEFARRKPQSSYPTEDTQYDNDVFALDLKRGPGAVFMERKWQDDFEEIPTGTYSPETATNLRFSPFNMMLRHGWVIASGLTKYLSDFVRYGSSTANSALTTKLTGGNQYSENGNIINSELERARYVPTYIEFEHTVTTEIMQQIEGFTEINGKKIPNVYGLIEFRDENNDLKKGYLITLKPNEGKFKLLIANR